MLHIPDDRPKWTDECKLLTKEHLNIPAMHMIGHADFHTASVSLDTHYHCNMEFVVIVNGKQQYTVDNKHYVLYGGDIFMTYPYEQHGNGQSPQDVCEFIWFQLDLSFPKNFLGLTPPYSDYLFHRLLNYKNRIKKATAKELSILRRSFNLLGSSGLGKQIQGYNYFLQFILNNICTEDIPLTKDIYSMDIQESMAYIHSHLLDDLNIEKIASHCGLSPSRFKAKFREQLGITPHAYINSLKIDTAKVLLKDPKNTITDVAFSLNFSSSNHFASLFKKHTGYTPTYFRHTRFSNFY